jgi:hypothetical protein
MWSGKERALFSSAYPQIDGAKMLVATEFQTLPGAQ